MRRYAVVTGASRGIGAAVARAFVERGISVLGIARSEATLTHPGYHHVRLDLSQPSGVEAFFEGQFAPQFAPAVDADEVILVNNCGTIGEIEGLASRSLTTLDRELALNATVPIWLMGFMARCFSGRSMRIVNLTSGAADRPYAGWASYCASKAALLMASRVFAEEQALIREQERGPFRGVVCLAPGSVETDIQKSIREAGVEAFPELEKFHRLKDTGGLFCAREVAEVLTRLIETEPHELFQNLRYIGAQRLTCLECGRTYAVRNIQHGCCRGMTASWPVLKSA